MTKRRNWLHVLGSVLMAVLAGVLLFVLLLPDVYAELLANIERVRALRGLDLPLHERSLDEAAWDSGWRSLCSPDEGAAPLPMPASERALEFSALASIDRGDYATARQLLQRMVDDGLADDEPNALAYRAALDMDWIVAARVYEAQATPRHERWWGTVFYLAAQQLMFEGELDGAAELYRRADAAYGVHGPYLGLGLVECLVQQGRTLEAWDAYRRALVVMLPEEAMAHLSRFYELRLEGLRAWHDRDPESKRVAHWLAFYEEEARREPAELELFGEEPLPQVSLELDLGDGRTLLGFDYRVEDLETGPFMEVDFYLRDGEGEQARIRRLRQTVLNQAPNGAFAWDDVPDGVRPVGWHGLVFSHDLAAVSREEVVPGEVWLCMYGGAIEKAFGLQSTPAAVGVGVPNYFQGGDAYVRDGGTLGHGRRWFGTVDTPYPYSYLAAGRLQDAIERISGAWIPVDGVEAVAVWLYSLQEGRACVRNVYLFPLPALDRTE